MARFRKPVIFFRKRDGSMFGKAFRSGRKAKRAGLAYKAKGGDIVAAGYVRMPRSRRRRRYGFRRRRYGFRRRRAYF